MQRMLISMALSLYKIRWTIIETLLAIAIIATVAGVVVPKVMAVRITRNERNAISTLRTIMEAERVYAHVHGQQGYSPSIRALAVEAAPPGRSTVAAAQAAATGAILDPSYAREPLQSGGYVFSYTAESGRPVRRYVMHAEPMQLGISGMRSFYADQNGYVRANLGAPADARSIAVPE